MNFLSGTDSYHIRVNAGLDHFRCSIYFFFFEFSKICKRPPSANDKC